MRILSFRIENFRNLRLAECSNPPDFMVICGGNGCGKSALLEALMTAKEHAGGYGNFSFDPRAASADRDIYEAAYPPSKHNVSFVPAGNSATVRKTAEQVNALLTASVGFQQYFSIVDGDIERLEAEPTVDNRIFRLPVYHMENLLLDDNEILAGTRSMMGSNCPYTTAEQVGSDLQKLVLSDAHLKPYTKALLDARLAKATKAAYDAVYRQETTALTQTGIPEYSVIEEEAKRLLQSAIDDGTWRSKCNGRELLRAYCGQHGLRYEHFRNLLIGNMKAPPKVLADIMDKILAD